MDSHDLRDPARDERLAKMIEAASPPSPFTEADIATVEAKIMRDAALLMRRRRFESRARRFVYRVALPASLAAELLIAFRLVTPSGPPEPAVAPEEEIMQTVALDAMLGTDVGLTLSTGNVYALALSGVGTEGEPND